LTNSVLNAGNIVPKPTPRNSATAKNRYLHNTGFHTAIAAQEESTKKQTQTRYIPKAITCVTRPLSTWRPEKILEIAIPTAISVKKIPTFDVIPISAAYIATYVVVIP
jgi:hypothetical protein